jgi:hypothetical protein
MAIFTVRNQVIALIIISGLLRLTGITWGIPIIDGITDPIFCDETWMMEGLAQINPTLRDFNPEYGNNEGTLSYIILTLIFVVLKVLGFITALPHQVELHSYNYGLLMLIGRITVLSFDITTILFIFFTLRLICKTKIAPFVASISLSFLPFEVIYSHFLRAHIIGNTFVATAIYFALLSLTSNRNRNIIISGAMSGFAAASRYPLALIIIVPICMLISTTYFNNLRLFFRNILCRKILYSLILSFCIAFLIGCPFLILDFQSVRKSFSMMLSFTATSEFSLEQITDMTRIKAFIWKLIPDGTRPYLWIPLYGAVLYLPTRPKLYKLTIPLLLFIFSLLFFMSKGYFTAPIFVRAMLPIFPVLSICFGIALDDVLLRISNHTKLRFVTYFILILTIAPSFLFSAAYTFSMGYKEDPRIAAAKYLQQEELSLKRQIRIAQIGNNISYIFPVSILQSALQYPNIESYYKIKSLSYHWRHQFDFIIVTALEGDEDEELMSLFNDEAITTAFEIVKIFKNEISILGMSFDYAGIAHDMSYPFPRIYVLRPKINVTSN